MDTDSGTGPAAAPRAFTPNLTPDPAKIDLGSLWWRRVGPDPFRVGSDPGRPGGIEFAQVEHGVVARPVKTPEGPVLAWSWADWDGFRTEIALGFLAFPDRGHPEPCDADDTGMA